MVAQGYAGHQFGQFVPSLGDGRALLLGEIRGTDGVLRDIHLKGSGRTRYSRGADGRAALGPALREYLVSEAMHALGVPTTRALAVVTTGRKIQRDRVLPGAVVVRVATSHIRVGSFQYANITGGIDLTRRLADHAITRHYPQLGAQFPEPGPERYSGFFQQVMDAQAQTVARWMRLGFVHGVLNTDNTLVSGETIDYGPCAFLDRFDPATFFSSIDTHGRYAFRNQPAILGWNLARLAEAMVPLIDVETAQETMNSFPERWEKAQAAELARTLGTDDADIGRRWLEHLEVNAPDLTESHRLLNDDPDSISDAQWVADWRALDPQPMEHPFHIPRNHLLDAALRSAESGDLTDFHELLDAVTDPYSDHGVEFRGPAPEGFDDMFRTFCGT